MEQAPIQSAIYVITHKGNTDHYVTEKFGNLRDVLTLLHQVHTAREKHPDDPMSEVDRMLQYSKSMVPICVSPHLRLFQPLEQEEFDFVLGEIEGGGGGTAYYDLNFDEDRFSVTSWSDNELKTASGSLQQTITATSRAFKTRDGASTHFSQKALVEYLSVIMTVAPAAAGPVEPQSGANTEADGYDQEDKPANGPIGFTDPSM